MREKDEPVREFEKQSHSEVSKDSAAPFSSGRRTLLAGMAASCAGVTASALAPKNLLALAGNRCTVQSATCRGPLRTQQGRCFGRGYGGGDKRGEDPGIQAERCIHFQRGAVRRVDLRSRALYATCQTRTLDRNSQRAGLWPRLSAAGFTAHFDTDGHNLASHDEDAFLLHRGSAILVPGEDCLRVNVWTPEINGSHKRPVMVYMHGGGFSGGSDHDLLSYEGESLARNHDVVVVTHNHRLNVYGYLNLGAIGGEEFAMSANVGMLDIVAVLEWVRTNIVTFGGDPDCVTIFGQSGGGGKVAALMAMPAAKGLFHRAIIQSGPFLKALSPDYSQRVAELLLDELGLSKSQVRELQKIPVRPSLGSSRGSDEEDAQASTFPSHWTFGESGWGPTVDGRVLPSHPFDPGAPAISADIPLITGTDLNEGCQRNRPSRCGRNDS